MVVTRISQIPDTDISKKLALTHASTEHRGTPACRNHDSHDQRLSGSPRALPVKNINSRITVSWAKGYKNDQEKKN